MDGPPEGALGRAGRFELLSRIGSGGMGDIYLAVLRGPEGFARQAVVKRLRRELASDETYRRMFANEARLMSGLSHGNLVSVLDFGEEDGGFYLALEHVDGIDLGQLLSTGGKLPAPLAVAIVSSVLHGLAYLHARGDGVGGIVHRDVSPENILLGNSGEVKLGDFGIAKALLGPSWTAPGTIKGNLAYASPEQAMGTTLDGRSDLFSAGVVLFRCLTGRSPFDATTEAELLIAVRDSRLIGWDLMTEAAGPALTTAIRRALAHGSAGRFADAEEMARALAAAVPPLPPLEAAAQIRERVSRARQNPLPRGSAFTAVLRPAPDDSVP